MPWVAARNHRMRFICPERISDDVETERKCTSFYVCAQARNQVIQCIHEPAHDDSRCTANLLLPLVRGIEQRTWWG